MDTTYGRRVQRTKVPLLDDIEAEDHDPDPDVDRVRVYYSPDDETPPMVSVTTIKELRRDPEKADAIAGWKSHYDGNSAWARPWWKDQKVYKGHRGTLIHFAILDALGDASGETYFHEVGDTEWGHEEYYSEYCLKKWSKKAPSANDPTINFQPRDNTYDGEHAWDRVTREMKWATKAFKDRMIDGIVGQYELHDDDYSEATDSPMEGRLADAEILGVEEFVYDPEYGYGGQYDLLYETADGTTVLSDVKTSSGLRFDHKLQSAAYKRAIERACSSERTRGDGGSAERATDAATDVTIDETEVVRLYPDDEVVEVSRSPQWDRTLEGLEHEFLGLADAARCQYSKTIAAAQKELGDYNGD